MTHDFILESLLTTRDGQVIPQFWGHGLFVDHFALLKCEAALRQLAIKHRARASWLGPSDAITRSSNLLSLFMQDAGRCTISEKKLRKRRALIRKSMGAPLIRALRDWFKAFHLHHRRIYAF